MKNIQLQEKALRASFVLHDELLNDCNYEGYEGDKEAFDRLYDEVLVICAQEVPDDADIEMITETFHTYKFEQMNGEREIDWYLF
jgi:hypothetical protein